MMKNILNNKTKIAIILTILVIIAGIVVGIIALNIKKSKKIIESKTVTVERVAYFEGASIVKIVFEEKYELCDKKLCSDVDTRVLNVENLGKKVQLDLQSINIKTDTIYEALNKIITLDYEMDSSVIQTFVIHNSANLRIDQLSTIENVDLIEGYLEEINEEDILRYDTDTYVVSFNTDGGNNISSQIVNKDERATQPGNPVKDGYIFVEWQLDGKKFDFNSPITDNITIIAVWQKFSNKKNESSTNNKGISSKTNKNNNQNNNSNNSTAEQPNNYENSNNCNPIGKTIYFDSNGGKKVSPIKIEIGKAITIPTLERDGYIFMGWYLDGKPFEGLSTCINKDITVVAKWEKLPEYTVKFVVDEKWGKISIPSQTVTAGEKIKLPILEDKCPYTFIGWKDEYGIFTVDGELINGYWTTRDTTLYAEYVNLGGSFNVTLVNYYGPDSSEVETKKYSYLPYDLKPYTPSGYTFVGWYKDSSFTQKEELNHYICKDTTLYAKYVKND